MLRDVAFIHRTSTDEISVLVCQDEVCLLVIILLIVLDKLTPLI